MMRISILLVALCVEFVFACQDKMKPAADTAKSTAKKSIERADSSLATVIDQIKENEDDIKGKNNETDTNGTAGAKKHLRHTQQVDANSTLSSYQLMFNAEVINKLEALLVDTKAESKRFEISQELEELLK